MKKFIILFFLVIVIVIIIIYISKPNSKNINTINNQQTSAIQSMSNTHLKSEAFLSRIKEPNMTIIDVRTADEYNIGHIDGSINMDFYSPDFVSELKKLDKEKPYSIYCRSGSRSAKALEMMSALGFTNIADLDGGYSSL